MPRTGRLSAEDWAAAALDAVTEGGLGAIAVERIAARLGATKGSFYWHFENRSALVDAALALWEQRETSAVIDGLESVGDARERLRRLLVLTAGRPGTIDPVVSLFRDVADERVRRTLDRVTRRRVGYVQELLAELGTAPDPAVHGAILGYATYLGWWQLMAIAPDLVAGESARSRYVELLLELLSPLDREEAAGTPGG